MRIDKIDQVDGMLKGKDTIIFDLDGTLVDSMSVWGEVDIEFLGKRGFSVPTDLQPAVEGMSFADVAVYFKDRFSLPDSVEEIQAEWNRMAYGKYAGEVSLKDGVAQFLPYLKDRGFRMGVASSNSLTLVKAALEAHGILPYFSCLLTCNEVEKGKPAPDVYLEVARRLHANPENCVVFEDIPSGILAGNAAGMTTCAVYDTYSTCYDEEKRELADYYIYSYRDIMEGDVQKH